MVVRKHIPGRLVIPEANVSVVGGFSPEQIERFHAAKSERLLCPDDEVSVERLCLLYDHATQQEIQDGLAWYGAARDFSRSLMDQSPRLHSMEHGAGIVAVLSPQESWAGNQKRAIAFVRGQKVGGKSWCLRSAEQILSGADPFRVLHYFQNENGEYVNPRTNYKTQAFYCNIVGRDSQRVTVDRHGWAMLYGDRQIGSVLLRPSKAQYAWAEQMFHCAAAKYGIPTQDFQAVTWLVWRKNDLKHRIGQASLFD